MVTRKYSFETAAIVAQNIKERDYWLNKLAGDWEKTTFPSSFQKSNLKDTKREPIKFQLTGQLFSRLVKLSNNSDNRLFMVLLAGLAVLINKYTGNEDIIVGTSICKQDDDVELVNTVLTLRNQLEKNMTFKELLISVKQTYSEAAHNQDYPCEALIYNLNLPDSENDFPLFDIAILLGNIHEEKYIRFTNPDILFSFFRWDEMIEGVLEYNPSLYEKALIERIITHYLHLLRTSVNNVNFKISELDVLPEEEKWELIHDFNSAKTEYPKDKVIHQLFEEQARKTPDNIALVCKDSEFTYKQLNEEANRVARVLRAKDVGADVIVGLILAPSIEMITAIFGILKAGGGYLPINPDYPGERINWILADSNLKLLISHSRFADNFEFKGELIDIDSWETYKRESSNLEISSDSEHLAYIVYTSGSTGKPKGVMVRHRNVITYLYAFYRKIEIAPGTVMLQQASYMFDVFVEEIYAVLLKGGCVAIPERFEIVDVRLLFEFIAKHNVTMVDCSPLLLNELNKLDKIKGVHTFISGGDVLKKEYIDNLLKIGSVYNSYGPAETTVCVTYYKCSFEDPANIPIGKPLANYNVYILDKNNRVLPPGVSGELCVSGDSVTRGYLNRPGLTGEMFIENPFSRGERLYKTGDLARWRFDGNIEFSGRIDQQVKIRGYRIELGEVENQLLNINGIEAAVVITREREAHDRYLCAYLVSDTKLKVTPLREFLQKRLPDYMIPSYFVQIDSIPFTANGKIDRKALPDHDHKIETGEDFAAPGDDVEKALAVIWSEVLGIEKDKVSINDNFFLSGGHSLAATILVSRIHRSFNVRIPFSVIFETPTIKGLAEYVKVAKKDKYAPIEAAEEQEHYPLSHGQQRLWFVSQLEQGSEVYNMAGTLVVEGELNVEAVKGAFDILLDRHESLRTTFFSLNGEPRQKIHNHAAMDIERIDLSQAGNQKESMCRLSIEEAHAPFDLGKCPLLRAKILKLSELKHLFMLTMHHIIGDGVSITILFDEYQMLYRAFCKGEGNPFPPLKLQYRDYVRWERGFLTGEKLNQLKLFWNEHFGGQIKLLNLPIDKPRSKARTFNGERISFRMDEELTAMSYGLVEKYNITVYIFFLTIFNMFLAKICQQEDITVVSGTAGREHDDLENIVGIFVRGHGIKNHVSPGQTFADFLKAVTARSLEARENSFYPFEMMINDYSGGSGERNVVNVHFNLFSLGSAKPGETRDHTANASALVESEFYLAKDDFSLEIVEDSPGLDFNFEYNTDLISRKKARLLVAWFKNIAREIICYPGKEINWYHLSTGRERELYEYLDIPEKEMECVYPFTPTQRDLHLDCLLNPEGKAHRLIYYNVFPGFLDIESWKEIMTRIYELYPILKAKLVSSGDDLYLGIRKNVDIHLDYIDLTGENLCENDIETRMKELVLTETHNLNREPVRHYLVKISAAVFINLISAHHIIFDGLSGKIVFEKFHELYNKLEKCNDEPVGHEVYLNYHQQDMGRFDTTAVKRYWRKKFSDIQKLKSAGKPGSGGGFVINKSVVNRDHMANIHLYCKENGISVPRYFRSLFGWLIRLYCAVDGDFVIREIIDGRDEFTKDIVGCFYQTVPMVFAGDVFQGEKKIADYFQYVRTQRKELGANRYISIFLQNQLIEEEDIIFFYNYSTFFQLDIADNCRYLVKIVNNSKTGKVDFPGKEIHLRAGNTAQGFQLELSYNEGVFNGDGFLERLLHVSGQIVEGAQYMRDIDFVTEKEKSELIRLSSMGVHEYPEEKNLCQFFADQVEKAPDQTAVVFEDRGLTYGELDKQSNRLAYLLQVKGVRPGAIAAIMAGRSLETIIGILGIIKAGGTYLPIDPDYPEERIRYMLADSNAGVLLSEVGELGKLSEGTEVVKLNELREEHPTHLTHPARPAHLCYIIYTSGTTGKPKGVLIEHRNLVRLFFNDKFQFDFNSSDIWSMFHSPCFDFSVWEMYGALLFGGKLIVISKMLARDTSGYLERLKKEKVTVLNQTPTAFYHLCREEMKHDNKALKIRYVIFGGEELHPLKLKPWRSRYPGTKLVNMYGITETTVHVTYKEITDKEIELNQGNIGKPIPTSGTYIMDGESRLLPVEIAGEICVGGAGVSRGYLNRVDLTAEKFIENPYKKGEKVYRSGDLGKLSADGELRYLGRMDHQVQLRGFRVELGEIESQLLRMDEIKEAVVIARDSSGAGSDGHEGDGKYLCAYLAADEKIDLSTVRKKLSGVLPDYMIPNYFVPLDEIPLTANGKVNRKALPEPTVGPAEKAVVPPRDKREEMLVEIWSEVLGLDAGLIGINSDFFELGGHSLKAATVVSNIQKKFDVRIPLAKIFETPTIRGLVQQLENAVEDKYRVIETVEEKEYYPLSSAQKRLYILRQMEEESSVYNIPVVLSAEGFLHKEKIENSFKKLIRRHESLRTSFEMIGGEPVQTLHNDVNFEIEYYEAPGARGEESYAGIITGFIRSFDLIKAPLMRAGLIKIEEDKHLLMMDIHHIAADGSSMGILVKDFMALYREQELPPLRIQYKEYCQWQKNKKDKENISKQRDFWEKEFAGDIPVLNLPSDFTRPAVQRFEGDTVNFELAPEETKKLKDFTNASDSTLNMVLIALLNVFLAKLSGQENIIIGIPTAGRRHADLQQIIGIFVNTLAFMNFPKSEKTFEEFLREVKERTLNVFENQEYPFEDLVDHLSLDRDISRNPLFDVMLTLQVMDIPEIKIPGLQLKPYNWNSNIAKFDLTLYAVEIAAKLFFSFEYSTNLFKADTIIRFANYFKKIVLDVLKEPVKKLSEIEMITEEEKSKILYDFNKTAVEFPNDKTIHHLFGLQVEKAPHHIAAVFQETYLTYRELGKKADQLAKAVRQKGVIADTVVGILVEPSLEMIIGIMGILKAGGAYLPIPPEYPPERITYMLEDSGSCLVLTRSKLGKILQKKWEIVELENHNHWIAKGEDLNEVNRSDDLAYVIYTSGSTGRPKGVMIEHRALCNLCHWHNRFFEVTSADRALKYAGFGFDASVWEIFPYLIVGAAIYIVEDEIKLDMVRLNDYFETNKITIGFLPTHICEQFMQSDSHSLRILLTGGDKLNSWTKKGYRLVNNYGPTENTVVSTSFVVTGYFANIPIGKPIFNTQIYILNNNGKLQPPGIPGELCVSGASTARGYLNQMELTGEKFTASSFAAGERLYWTGDLAKWLPDGNIEFLGRVDQQVKVRGFRIEPGEVENHLLKCNGVKEAVVIPFGCGDDTRLCAYIVTGKKSEMDLSRLRDTLSKTLPASMIPAYFMEVDHIPLTPNGKIDRKALPVPETGGDDTAPRNEVEEKLAEIWRDVLRLEKGMIGIDANFFGLGGDSLKAAVVVSLVHKTLNLKMPLTELFKKPTIRELSKYINELTRDEYTSIKPVEKKEYYPQSSAQKSIYVTQQLNKKSITYNLPIVFTLAGELDREKLEETFAKLIKRHESLRTSFGIIDEEPLQAIHDEVEFKIEYDEASPLRLERVIQDFVKPFALERAPLLNAALIKVEERKHVMVVNMHHIVTDGASIEVFVKDFMALYEGKELPPLSVHYKEYTEWQSREKQKQSIKKQGEYWRKEFEGEIPVLNLPTDYPRPAVRSFEGSTLDFEIGPLETGALKNLALEEKATLFIVLLTIYTILLSKLSGQEDIVVGTVIAGRKHVDLKMIIGMFVNTLALRNYPGGEKTFIGFLKEVKERVLKAFENQDYPCEDIIDVLEFKKDMGRFPLYNAAFGLQNLEFPGLQIPGLTLKPYEIENKTSKFDLSLAALEKEGKLSLLFEYSTRLFKKSTIKGFIKYFKEMVSTVIKNRHIQLKDIKISHELFEQKLDIPTIDFKF
ncbi:MAG: amino acid adenylation domain-containing protein [Candidatus Aminicenantes bacterium]|nr:amino acid adenylation domain-containing protein [Candidatus Aminicenantes bacterium]NIM83447.1 amino acid adenylation domain-containing protein [Candidatus Aminicenantes bacterium]NIN22839.1 amino acid adenylation domain-containing protein [Candidatus Aminicenantes bacterium]NIN46575.1 amino acid adenylation domain-containing protein [Candidatus Aminicenantes bacterium]NIN89478.1 amino acid adenylation domain-containing protein [Candidatus Aminicenantes bacterium]